MRWSSDALYPGRLLAPQERVQGVLQLENFAPRVHRAWRQVAPRQPPSLPEKAILLNVRVIRLLEPPRHLYEPLKAPPYEGDQFQPRVP